MNSCLSMISSQLGWWRSARMRRRAIMNSVNDVAFSLMVYSTAVVALPLLISDLTTCGMHGKSANGGTSNSSNKLRQSVMFYLHCAA
jgi:hypothetical protein